MKIFESNFKKHPKISGELKKSNDRVSAEIGRIDTAPIAVVTQYGFSGQLKRLGKLLYGAIGQLSVLYRFISSNRMIRMGRFAKADTAQAVEAYTDRAIQNAHEATADTVPVAEAESYGVLQMGRMAAPVTAPAAEAESVKGMAMGKYAAPSAVVRILAHADKTIVLGRISEAEAAPGVNTKAAETFSTGKELTAGTAPSVAASTESSFSVIDEATASAAPGKMAAADRATVMGKTARAATWIEPYIDAEGYLVIKQAYNATPSGGFLEVE